MIEKFNLERLSTGGRPFVRRLGTQAFKAYEVFHHTASGVVFYPLAMAVSGLIHGGQNLAEQAFWIWPIKQALWWSVSGILALRSDGLTRRIIRAVRDDFWNDAERVVNGVTVTLPKREYEDLARDYLWGDEATNVRRINFC